MAVPSRTITEDDARIIRALIKAGWAQHDVASLMGCNPGRVAEVWTEQRHPGTGFADLADARVKARLAEIQTAWVLRIGTQMAAVHGINSPDVAHV